ncbi:unnamed protein product [Amaranthus hypochondriacus]
MRQKLSAMIATGEESAPTMRIGAMVMNEDARFANMRLLNISRVKNNEPKVRASSISSSTDIKQGESLMVINGEVNEVPTRLLVDTGTSSHNFLAREEAKALRVKFTRVDGEMRRSYQGPRQCMEKRGMSLSAWGSGRERSISWWSTLMMRTWCWAWSSAQSPTFSGK